MLLFLSFLLSTFIFSSKTGVNTPCTLYSIAGIPFTIPDFKFSIKADGGPGQRWRGRRTGQQESETGACCASPCACQEKGRGNGATADLAAQTRSATAAALALRPASTVSARTRIRTPKPQPEVGRTGARRYARRYRGANQGQRGPLRGGQGGRWGRW
jgi:hypothetical protein